MWEVWFTTDDYVWSIKIVADCKAESRQKAERMLHEQGFENIKSVYAEIYKERQSA